MNKPTILVYTPLPLPWATKLKALCAIRDFRFLPVGKAELDAPLLSLLDNAAAGEHRPGPSLPEPVMVFCHLAAPQLDRLLPELRKLGTQGCLKAVLTPTNKGWTLRQLYAELCREREELGAHAPQR